MADLTIPFIILLALTIALLFDRKYNESKIIEIYEAKYKQWKSHTKIGDKKTKCKELVGLLFLEDEKLHIKLLDKKVKYKLEHKKFTIKS
jgi:hypothetical protein